VKAFNHLAAETLAEDPNVDGGRRVVFLSSDDQSAGNKVTKLVERLGFARLTLSGWLAWRAIVHARRAKPRGWLHHWNRPALGWVAPSPDNWERQWRNVSELV
jgi:hypothetical protein